MMTYPDQHQEIVRELLAGKFVLETSPFYNTLQDNKAFYTTFFEKSFGYELNHTRNYFFLTSKQTKENSSRDLILFLALLAYEYHNEQRDFVKEIRDNTFDLAETERLIKASSKYEDLLKDSTAEDLEAFINHWHKKHLLTFVDPQKSKFRFKAPINTFLDVAAELSEQHLQDKMN